MKTLQFEVRSGVTAIVTIDNQRDLRIRAEKLGIDTLGRSMSSIHKTIETRLALDEIYDLSADARTALLSLNKDFLTYFADEI